MTLKIRYVDFWPNFEPENFIFTKLLRSNHFNTDVSIVNNLNVPVDLEICSGFPFGSLAAKLKFRTRALGDQSIFNDYISRTNYGYRLNYETKTTKRIWYTGENLRPPQELFDGTISFDKTDQVAKNVFFPLIYFELDWFPNERELKSRILPSELVKERTVVESQLLKACSFATNLAPDRQRIVRITNPVFPVDEFGKSVAKYVASKSETSRNYLFQICNENSFFPGYVTEKLIDAWASGNIPIWSGCTGSEIPLNPDSYIDVSGLIEEEITDILRSLKSDKIDELRRAPLMNHVPSIQPLIEFFQEQVK